MACNYSLSLQAMQVSPRAPGRREQNNQRRHARLLAVARRQFDAHGVDATTMERIAAAARVATRTVYNFFPTKLDLLAAVLRHEIEARVSAVPASPQAGAQSPERAVVSLLRRQIASVAALPKRELRLVTAHAILTAGESEAGRYLQEVDRFLRQSLFELLEAHARRGTLPAGIDPQAASEQILALLNGVYHEWLEADGWTLESRLPLLTEFCTRLLAPSERTATPTTRRSP